MFQLAVEKDIEAIDFLYFAKECVRQAYRRAKLEAHNIEPQPFLYRLWTLVSPLLI